jgi:radical SAM/Cys-rich protein
MSQETIEEVLRFLRASSMHTLDLTGGAPELNPHFRYLVSAARALGVRVIDRCNLTILEESGQEDLAEFLASHQVEIIASLPCYLEDNVDRQRGKGVFNVSLWALRRLNRLIHEDPARQFPRSEPALGHVLHPCKCGLAGLYLWTETLIRCWGCRSEPTKDRART